MDDLSERHGIAVVQRALRFHSVRLRSCPGTAAPLQEVEQVRTRLQEADQTWQQAREQRVAGTAELAYRDALLDAAVLALSREVAVWTSGRRDDPRARRLFPTAPSQAVRGSANEAQARFVRTLIATLREDPVFEPLRRHADLLASRLAEVDAARSARDALYVPEEQAVGVLRQVLAEARRLYNLQHARLTLLLPDDRALVESCFTKLGVGGRAERGEEEAAAAGSTGPGHPQLGRRAGPGRGGERRARSCSWGPGPNRPRWRGRASPATPGPGGPGTWQAGDGLGYLGRVS